MSLGALGQQREQAAVFEARAVEAVYEDEWRYIFAPLGAGELTQLVITGLSLPGTATETCLAFFAISTAAGSSRAVTSSGKKLANSPRAAALTVTTVRRMLREPRVTRGGARRPAKRAARFVAAMEIRCDRRTDLPSRTDLAFDHREMSVFGRHEELGGFASRLFKSSTQCAACQSV